MTAVWKTGSRSVCWWPMKTLQCRSPWRTISTYRSPTVSLPVVPSLKVVGWVVGRRQRISRSRRPRPCHVTLALPSSWGRPAIRNCPPPTNSPTVPRSTSRMRICPTRSVRFPGSGACSRRYGTRWRATPSEAHSWALQMMEGVVRRAFCTRHRILGRSIARRKEGHWKWGWQVERNVLYVSQAWLTLRGTF